MEYGCAVDDARQALLACDDDIVEAARVVRTAVAANITTAQAAALLELHHAMASIGMSAQQFADMIARIPPPDAYERALLEEAMAHIEARRRPWWRKLLDALGG